MLMESAIVFAVTGFTLRRAHGVADHILQTDCQAANKAKPGRQGWSAMLGHVFSYHVLMAIMLLAVIAVFHLPVTALGFFTALAFSAVTHAFIDRRWPVKKLLEMTGSPKFAEMVTPVNGMYVADQDLHNLVLWGCALILAII